MRNTQIRGKSLKRVKYQEGDILTLKTLDLFGTGKTLESALPSIARYTYTLQYTNQLMSNFSSSLSSRAANGRNVAGLYGLSYKHEILLRCSILYHYQNVM